ncbi:hypothetical protein [Saccharopolyspora shandongensis]|uniref:hypothetical protein n=1 Tax=Saccharopolyspora shandongensis TaxID=418495 RepID=UPI0033FF7A43
MTGSKPIRSTSEAIGQLPGHDDHAALPDLVRQPGRSARHRHALLLLPACGPRHEAPAEQDGASCEHGEDD